MASLYKRPRSPYWWIKCRDTAPESPTFGKTIFFSSGLRIGIGPDTRAARQRAADITSAERKMTGGNPAEAWSGWVPDYLSVYCKVPITLTRYKTIWRTLCLYLTEKGIDLPRQLTRARCLDYMTWRLKPDTAHGKYRAVWNTARLELKILSLIMGEAVRRNFAPFNPVRDLGLRKERSKEKPEFTDEHLAFIANAVEKEPPEIQPFLKHSFLLARYHGCRLNETHLNPQTDVDISQDGSRGLIRFRIKGGREHTVPLHPKLIPLFQELKKNRATKTYTKPPNPSRKWFDFMKRIGLRKLVPGACFHSLRVTAVTRLARSGSVPESQAMRFIGHASTTVHRTYQRLRTEDLDGCLNALDDAPDKPKAPGTPGEPAANSEPPTEKNSACEKSPSPS